MLFIKNVELLRCYLFKKIWMTASLLVRIMQFYLSKALEAFLTNKNKEVIMKGKREIRVEDYTELCCQPAGRPIIWVKDAEGYGWLCDKAINSSQDLRRQKCWRCDEIAFPAGGR